jgi:thioredoxin reductase
MIHDVVIVGGSYAGLSAALQLARARKDVLVVDAGRRRNRFTAHAHGFLGHDGWEPGAIAAAAREQLLAYPTVRWVADEVTGGATKAEGFTLSLAGGETVAARRVVLAPGVEDVLPDVPGLAERWGRGVYNCPYCDGYERGGGPLGVLAVGPVSMHQALLVPDWGPTTLFLNGAFEPTGEERAALAARGVTVEPVPVSHLSDAASVVLADGRTVELAGLFTAGRTRPNGTLAHDLGCALEAGPTGPFIATDMTKQTSVPGVFACGDAARAAGSVALAVGDGAMAGAAAHRSLLMG